MTSRTQQAVRRGAAAVALVMAVALAAAACGGGSSTNSTSTAGAGGSAPAATATRASAQVSSGGAYGGAAPTSSGGAASSGAASISLHDTALGKVLADASGMTLYTFAKDTKGSGKSACSGGCATNWPPLTVTGGAPSNPAGVTGALTVVTRDDGSMQIAYNGMPLYRFAADKAPGDTKGDGVGGIWSVAKP